MRNTCAYSGVIMSASMSESASGILLPQRFSRQNVVSNVKSRFVKILTCISKFLFVCLHLALMTACTRSGTDRTSLYKNLQSILDEIVLSEHRLHLERLGMKDLSFCIKQSTWSISLICLHLNRPRNSAEY